MSSRRDNESWIPSSEQQAAALKAEVDAEMAAYVKQRNDEFKWYAPVGARCAGSTNYGLLEDILTMTGETLADVTDANFARNEFFDYADDSFHVKTRSAEAVGEPLEYEGVKIVLTLNRASGKRFDVDDDTQPFWVDSPYVASVIRD